MAANADDCVEIALFAKERKQELQQYFKLQNENPQPRYHIPSICHGLTRIPTKLSNPIQPTTKHKPNRKNQKTLQHRRKNPTRKQQ